MKSTAMTIGAVALLGSILPPVLFLNGQLAQDPMKATMLVACLIWFITAPMWMKAS